MSRAPDVSILIAAGSDRVGLERSLASARRQQGDWSTETIVIDDGLLPPLNFGEASDAPTVLRQQLRLGRAASWNRGLASASGRFIALLDDHTRWHPEFLDAVLGGVCERSSTWGFSGAVWSRGFRFPRAAASRRLSTFPSRAATGSATSIVAERELLWQLGGLAPSYGPLAGWELSLRLASAAPGYRHPEALVDVSAGIDACWSFREVVRERRELRDKYGEQLRGDRSPRARL